MENESKNKVENIDSGDDKLLLSDVMQQRELLIAFVDWIWENRLFCSTCMPLNTDIDEFLESKQ